MFKLTPKEYDFSSVKGITPRQLQQHYKLYEGYVSKLNEIWNIPNDAKEFKDSNATYSKMRSLKLGETFALDGVKLHQLYFQNMTGGFNNPTGEIIKLIERDFNSYENFLQYFKNVGLAVRGWAILAIDPLDNKLHVFGADAHDVGAVWDSYPLLVMDVYEHAYFMDFGTDRSKYIDTFIKNINWRIVNSRLQKYNMIKSAADSMRYIENPSIYPMWTIKDDED
ncbi:superoxide dismutase [Clostridium sp. OS1-26]|uniref:superoxide dismutase n=1 Tax=Clostridium sp. OS1-26 TaxID=3070681 RepID=UPI0027E212FF|nr:superoxide dismutase [Clostridium sp. OS1-26]WML35457.1 superoxide dismutase [Clostridium sp. OS1-26]